jgi:DNA-binding MarR family transcriptional regulator
MIDIFNVEDMADFHLFRRFKLVAHLMRHLRGERQEDRLSHARMRLLIFVLTHQRMGNEAGVAPSDISDHLGVGRNTVSSLLNGLEEQGLIERHVNPEDRRQFFIRLSPQGIEQVETHAPRFAEFVTGLFEVFAPDERAELIRLLDKLLEHLIARNEASISG